eukprot:5796716-Amphidinium_carterae.2
MVPLFYVIVAVVGGMWNTRTVFVEVNGTEAQDTSEHQMTRSPTVTNHDWSLRLFQGDDTQTAF